MRKRADGKGVDLLLVDTGDRVEGNGLYDASEPKGVFTYDIYHQQDVDIICTGNHELYQYATAAAEHKYTVPNFKGKYIASNLDYIDPDTSKISPMAQRYRKFKTQNQGIEVLAFGFLFDFTGNANNTVVIPVERTVKEEWFQKAIREKPDIFVVIGHVGLRMEELKMIHEEIRKANWNAPIAIFAGHAHVRDAKPFDSRAFGMASGRYLETIGWMSVDGIKPEGQGATAAPSFTRKYLDNNLYGFHHHAGLNSTSFPTEEGMSVSTQIRKARHALNLDYRFGCAPKDLWMFRAPYPSSESIYSWLVTEVLPGVAIKKGRETKPRLAIFNSGGIRFDIFKGAFTRDSTYIVSPFVSKLHHIPDVPYYIARKVITLLNIGGPIFDAAGFDPRYMAVPEAWSGVEHVVAKSEEDDSDRRLELRTLNPQYPLGDDTVLTQGYTTIDDVGKDGDDTVHEPMLHYRPPNCVQSKIAFTDEEPDTVDLVFIDFITPWILLALRFAGADYTKADISAYRDETFTHIMADWIKEHWAQGC